MSTLTLGSAALASVLLIGPESVAEALQDCCGRAQPIARADDALAGLERLASGGVRTVFVWMAGLPGRATAAIAAMRELLGTGAKIYLIARPDEEPAARILAAGDADDYVIWPLQNDEMARVLDTRPAVARQDRPSPPVIDAGIVRLAEVLASAESDLSSCLDRAAAIVMDQLHARGCTIELPEMMSVCGEAIGEPVLAADMDLGAGRKGRLAVGPRRSGAYTAVDAGLLQACAMMLATVSRLAISADCWRQKAQTDELTGLLNRRGLMQALPDLLEQARCQRTPVTVLLFDMDNFKHYNDAYSHSAGDEILRETAQLFVRHCRKHDLVARYGGDEFMVVFWEANEPRVAGSKPPRDVLAVLDRFRKALERHEFRSLGPEARGALTISGGLVTFPWEAGSASELITRADEALLLAKQQGKNRIWLVGHGPQ
jgi:diguanylate cyclase (GGDEF)-like protein